MKVDREKKSRGQGGGAKERADTRPTTIRGIVVPVDWDEKGNVVAVAISAQDEDEYLITRDKNEEKLRALIREEVEVSGLMSEHKNKKTITVKRIQLKTRSSMVL